MTREDLIKLAREAGFDLPCDEESHDYPLELERFAALVEAAEREACAQLFDGKRGQADLRDIPGLIRARGQS